MKLDPDSHEDLRTPNGDFESLNAVEDSDQPLHEFILGAKEANDQLYEREHSIVPYRTELWHFTRVLKGRPEFDGLDADEAFDLICEELMRKYPGRDPWGSVLGLNDDHYLEFLTSWQKVRFAGNHDPLEYAYRLARTRPLEPPRCQDGRLDGYRDFVSLAGYLQVILGTDQNILLPCKTVGHKMDVWPSTVSRYRKLALDDGYLEEKKESRSPGDGGQGRATEFRFRLESFPELLEFEFDPAEVPDDDEERW